MFCLVMFMLVDFAVVVDDCRLKLMFDYDLIDYVKCMCVFVLLFLLMIGVCM